MTKEIEIPEGYEARIEDNKVILELKESDDERIRKGIIEHIKSQIDTTIPAPDCRDEDDEEELAKYNKWIAYLEKQKEQNFSHIEDIDYEENLDLANNAIGMIRNGACYINNNSRNEVLDWLKNVPKTIKQLTTKINELEKPKEQKPAEWSEKYIADIFEKVGLAKIVREQGNDKLTNAVQAAMIELSKGCEWSEKDERMRQTAIEACKTTAEKYKLSADRFYKCKDWLEYRLKSLRPQPHWKPSEEQMEVELEKEVKSYIKHNFTITDEVTQIPEEDRRYSMWEDDMMAFAKHFFELGRINARKEEKK